MFQMLQGKRGLTAAGLRWLLWELAKTLVKHEERAKKGEKGLKEGYNNFFKNGLHLTQEQIDSLEKPYVYFQSRFTYLKKN